MELDIRNKLAFVSGSTAGIGFAIARRLAAEGAEVVLNGRTEARVDSAVRQIQAEFPESRVRGIALDLSSASGATALQQALPDCDILINNLGIFEPKDFANISDQDWLRFFETNVMSGVRLARYYFPRMKQRNWGRIIFISSESAVQIPAEMIHYGMTKTAQISIARGLAQLASGTGVTVNSVLVGPTKSEGVATFVDDLAITRGVSPAQMESEFFASARPSSLLKRFIRPEEIGNFVAYLASPLSSATNGAALRADGGVVQAIL